MLRVQLIGCVYQAYLSICDMLIIFGRSIAHNSPQLEALVFDAGKELQLRLKHFLNDKVFIEEDDGMNSRLLLLNRSVFYQWQM